MKTLFITTFLTVAILYAGEYASIDPLILTGRHEQALDELFSLLRYEDTFDETLFRIIGIYHGSGREDECLVLLDSLENCGFGLLTGWRISLLDMSHRGAEAVDLIDPNDVYLAAWIAERNDIERTPRRLPVPNGIAERATMVMLASAGYLNIVQINLAIQDAELITLLEYEILEELEVSLESGGDLWDETAELLNNIFPSDELNYLLVARAQHLHTGSESWWLEMLNSDGGSGKAAYELLMQYPERYSEGWVIADVLISNGFQATAESLATISDNPIFKSGVDIALHYAQWRYQDILDIYDSLPDSAPDSLLARAALYRARALRALNRPPQEYFLAYLEFSSDYPTHPTAGEAGYIAAKYYDGECNWSTAADAYLASLQAGYTDTRVYWRGGFCHYMCGRGIVGDSLWEVGVDLYPHSAWSDEMLYWRARYAGKCGNSTLSAELLERTAEEHPWEFYGLLAARRLGRTFLDIEYTEVVLHSSDIVTSIALDMMKHGYGTMARSMLLNTRMGDIGLRASMLSLMGEHQSALTLLRLFDVELRSQGENILPDSLLCFYFPAPYRTLVEDVTEDMYFDAELLTGLMRQESYFNRWAGSPVGARGLIQLMPGTAGDIARWYGLTPLSGSDFYVPENSILFGAYYLNRQYQRFDNNAIIALAAYNAGPGNAARWYDTNGYDPADPELFIERITFIETRGYVKHVLANSWIYGIVHR